MTFKDIAIGTFYKDSMGDEAVKTSDTTCRITDAFCADYNRTYRVDNVNAPVVVVWTPSR